MSGDAKGFNPDYDDLKKENIIYFGKCVRKENGTSYRKVELFIEQPVNYSSDTKNKQDNITEEFLIKDEAILYESRNAQQKIHCWLVESESERYIDALHISRRTKKGVYGSQEITLVGSAVNKLIQFINSFKFTDLSNKNSFKLPISNNLEENKFEPNIITKKDFEKLVTKNINSIDDFYKLISLKKREVSIKKLESILEGNYTNEVEIQKFLKENLWMFGNDYAFVVEQDRINAENILDAIPKNLESFVDIIEVKLPNEKLFNLDKSHNNYYSTSNLTKAIAQTQNYIFELEKKMTDNRYQQENYCSIVRPKGIVLFGSDKNLNDEESKYLRILNSSYHNIQIFTYQQLFEKAKNTLCFVKDK